MIKLRCRKTILIYIYKTECSWCKGIVQHLACFPRVISEEWSNVSVLTTGLADLSIKTDYPNMKKIQATLTN